MGVKIMNGKNYLKKNHKVNNKNSKRRKYYLSMLEKQKKHKPPICTYFTYGACKKDDCIYSHDVTPDQMKKFDEMCKYYAVGACAKGEMCCYMHKTFPCLFFHSKLGNKCNKGVECLFSHEPLSEEKATILENHLKTQSNRGQVIEKNSENKDVLVAIQSNFGQSVFTSKELVGTLNSDNFGKSIFQESVSTIHISETFENTTKNDYVEKSISENEIEDRDLKIMKKSIIENPDKLSDAFLANKNEAISLNENYVLKSKETLYDSDTDSQLEICDNNITDLDQSEINEEKITSDNKKTNILENLSFHFDMVPKFTKIDFSDSDSEGDDRKEVNDPPSNSLSEEICNDYEKPDENVENNNKDVISDLIESQSVINQRTGNVFTNEMPRKNNKRPMKTEIFDNKHRKIAYPTDSSMRDQIQDLSTKDSFHVKNIPEKNETNRKPSIVNKRRNKNLKIPDNVGKISTKLEKTIDLHNFHTPLDSEMKDSDLESQIANSSNEEDDEDLFSGISKLYFTATKSSMELLGFDTKNCFEFENVISESNKKHPIKNEDCQSVTIAQSQSNSETGFLNNPVSFEEIINDSSFVNRDQVEIEKDLQTTEIRNLENSSNFDNDFPDREIGENPIAVCEKCVWQPPELILPPHLEYHKMDINCYNLRHKFDDPRIRNHPKALKQSILEWLNS